MSRPDYLSKPEHERKLLAGKEETKPKKAELDPLQIPLVLGQDAQNKKYICPRVACDECGFNDNVSDGLVEAVSVVGCPECGNRHCRVYDGWE